MIKNERDHSKSFVFKPEINPISHKLYCDKVK